MKNRPRVTDVNVLFFVFVMLFFLFQALLIVFVMFLALKHGGEYYESFFKDSFYTITLISQLAILLPSVLIFSYAKKLNIKEVFRFNNPGLWPMLLIIPASLAAYITAMALNGLAIYLLQLIGQIPVIPMPVPTTPRELAIGILVIAVTPAICEELMHRGIMLSAYERRGTIRALVFTAILFGIFHFNVANLLGPIFLGILIGYYVIRTNSIWAGMFAHFLNNTIAELQQYFFSKPQVTPESSVMTGADLFYLLLAGIVAFMFLMLMLAAFRAATAKKCRYVPAIASVKEDTRSIFTHWPIVIVVALYALQILSTILSIAR